VPLAVGFLMAEQLLLEHLFTVDNFGY